MGATWEPQSEGLSAHLLSSEQMWRHVLRARPRLLLMMRTPSLSLSGGDSQPAASMLGIFMPVCAQRNGLSVGALRPVSGTTGGMAARRVREPAAP